MSVGIFFREGHQKACACLKGLRKGFVGLSSMKEIPHGLGSVAMCIGLVQGFRFLADLGTVGQHCWTIDCCNQTSRAKSSKHAPTHQMDSHDCCLF